MSLSEYVLAVNMAMTIDGKTARPDGRWYGLSSRNDKIRMDQYRSEADALILGKNSLLNDNPVIKIRYKENANDPVPIILLRKGNISGDLRVFESPKKTIIICTDNNYSDLKNLSAKAEIISFGNEISPEKVINLLIERKLNRILLEGGPVLNAAFFTEDLVNRIYITLVPFIVGMRSLPSIVDQSSALPNFDSRKWEVESSETMENEIFLKYRRIREKN